MELASASLVEDYIAGTVGMDPNDPLASIYKVAATDVPFGQSWQDWIDAVDLGADFYDGNNDGIYNPVDLNGNNLWDPDEDKPDLILDETYWCVFNDGRSCNSESAGSIIDPCNWLYGEVRGGVQCNEVDPYFWLSGDPVSNIGWICTTKLMFVETELVVHLL